MNHINQSFGDSQSPSPENEFPLAPALLQEQQLFKRITIWTLFIGILIGISLVFWGVGTYDFFLTPRGGFHVVAPTIDELLVPLSCIPFGAIFVLRWKVQSLRTQLPTYRHHTDSTPYRQHGLVGFFMIGLGCFSLIGRAMDIPSSVALPILSVGGVGAFALILGADLYLSLREKRRTTQR